MSIILFLPAIICGIITIALLLNIEKDDEWLGKIWSFVLAVLFFCGTVFFTDLAFKNDRNDFMKKTHKTEFYNSHDYIY